MAVGSGIVLVIIVAAVVVTKVVIIYTPFAEHQSRIGGVT